MRSLALVIVLSLIASVPTRAALIFNLSNDSTVESLDNVPSFDLSQSGLTATLTALLDGTSAASAVLNGTKSSFGVNVTTGGGDKSSQIDGYYGTESVRITFDHRVRFESIDVSGFGSSDRGTFTVGSATPLILSSSGTVVSGSTLKTGNSALVSWKAGNGFSLNAFAVTVLDDPKKSSDPSTGGGSLSAVPEPSALPLELGALVLGFFALRRKRRQQT